MTSMYDLNPHCAGEPDQHTVYRKIGSRTCKQPYSGSWICHEFYSKVATYRWQCPVHFGVPRMCLRDSRWAGCRCCSDEGVSSASRKPWDTALHLPAFPDGSPRDPDMVKKFCQNSSSQPHRPHGAGIQTLLCASQGDIKDSLTGVGYEGGCFLHIAVTCVLVIAIYALAYIRVRLPHICFGL